MLITCIMCPLGCWLDAARGADGNITVEGKHCKRGKLYAEQELTAPKRVVTSLIPTARGVLPCKTDGGVDKDKIFDVLAVIKKTRITGAVKIGDVLIANVLDSGVSVVATKEI